MIYYAKALVETRVGKQKMFSLCLFFFLQVAYRVQKDFNSSTSIFQIQVYPFICHIGVVVCHTHTKPFFGQQCPFIMIYLQYYLLFLLNGGAIMYLHSQHFVVNYIKSMRFKTRDRVFRLNGL